jgi:hypothetical protein
VGRLAPPPVFSGIERRDGAKVSFLLMSISTFFDAKPGGPAAEGSINHDLKVTTKTSMIKNT